MTCCPDCKRPVLEVVMVTSSKMIRVDPEPRPDGNLQLLEGRSTAQFIAKERRDPKSRWYVPPAERYVSHMVTCPENERSLSSDTRRFIGAVDRRLMDDVA